MSSCLLPDVQRQASKVQSNNQRFCLFWFFDQTSHNSRVKFYFVLKDLVRISVQRPRSTASKGQVTTRGIKTGPEGNKNIWAASFPYLPGRFQHILLDKPRLRADGDTKGNVICEVDACSRQPGNISKQVPPSNLSRNYNCQTKYEWMLSKNNARSIFSYWSPF